MINIYIDTSGSMLEMGKDSALLYLAKSIEDYCSFKDINTNFFTLDTQVIKDLTSIKFSNDIKLDTNKIKSNNILIVFINFFYFIFYSYLMSNMIIY